MTAELPDLEEIVKTWALTMFGIIKSKDQAKIPKEALAFNVDWKNIRFKHHVPEYTELEKPPAPKAQILFKTFFSNNTDGEQEYSFKTERVTRSSCEVIIEKGVSTGHELSVKLQTPCEVFEANAGFHREVTLNSTAGEMIEEELTWEVDSQIKVPPHTRTTAELVIKEDQYSGKFNVLTELSGKITVVLNNLKDNNSFVTTLDGELSDIIKNSKGANSFTIQNSVVSYVTRGICNFRFAIEQHVKLNQEPIEE